VSQKQSTYKVEHSIIKEITIGEQFVTLNGEVVEFIGIDSSPTNAGYCFVFECKTINKNQMIYTYSLELGYWIMYGNDPRDIKDKYINMKEKIGIL
jgi:hypothetical protein